MPAALKRTSSARHSVSPPPSKRKIESTTTNKAVANFFTPLSKKEPDKLVWRVVNETLLLGSYKPLPEEPRIKRRKVAAFDLDSTLIRTASGNVFPKDAMDWQWWDSSVPATIKRLYADGYIIAILTNQGSLSLKTDSKSIRSDQRSLAIFKSKVSAVLSHFTFPILVLAATARDRYRKPRTGMWNELLEDLDLDVNDGPDVQSSFFVGDAGGRPATSSIKADHSCSDRNFAANVGIAFKTPEEFFLYHEPRPYSRTFEPQAYLDEVTDVVAASITKANPVDIIVMCGSPAAGKSTFYWNVLEPLGYERVNQDQLKSRDKCVKVASELVSGGSSVAVGTLISTEDNIGQTFTKCTDNTNADVETRAIWIQLGRKFGIPIRCVYFTAPAMLCEHNDTVRALVSGLFNPEQRSILPHSAFSSFASRFKEPSMKEGYQDITKVDFQFQGDAVQRQVWAKYWT